MPKSLSVDLYENSRKADKSLKGAVYSAFFFVLRLCLKLKGRKNNKLNRKTCEQDRGVKREMALDILSCDQCRPRQKSFDLIKVYRLTIEMFS